MIKVLVVEDDAGLREALIDTLALADIEAVAADSAQQALLALQRNKVDLIVSDVQMADGDGFALLHAVRRQWPNLPLLLMTAYANVNDAVRAIREGATDYLAKPFAPQVLVNMVSRYAPQHRDDWVNPVVADNRSRELLAQLVVGEVVLAGDFADQQRRGDAVAGGGHEHLRVGLGVGLALLAGLLLGGGGHVAGLDLDQARRQLDAAVGGDQLGGHFGAQALHQGALELALEVGADFLAELVDLAALDAEAADERGIDEIGKPLGEHEHSGKKRDRALRPPPNLQGISSAARGERLTPAIPAPTASAAACRSRPCPEAGNKKPRSFPTRA